MYLQVYKLRFTKTCAQALSDAQKMHMLLTKLAENCRASDNLLYRLEYKKEEPYLFVQSDALLRENENLEPVMTIDLSEKLAFSEGESIRFSLITSPHAKSHGKVSYFKTDNLGTAQEKRIRWVQRKLLDYGLEASSIREGRKIETQFFRKGSGKGTFTSYEYAVCGTIRQAELFGARWHKGFGMHKAYGSGMFLLRR